MERQRIQVYADPDTKRRIELAAARYDVSVTEYCRAAIEQQLAEDDMLEREQIEIPISRAKDVSYVADLRTLRERILSRRGGELIDVVAAIEHVREERDDELGGLR